MDTNMNQSLENSVEHKEKMGQIAENAIAFVKQLEVMGFDKKTLRFEGELNSKETLSYKKRFKELLHSVDKLDE